MVEIYVGNLPWQVTEGELEGLFKPYGKVERASVIRDRRTGETKGFGFIMMADEDAARAIEKVNGSELRGRILNVNQSRNPRRAEDYKSQQAGQL